MVKKKISKGSNVAQPCLDEARKSLSLFDSEDLHAFMNDVFDKAKSYEGLDRNTALKRALEQSKLDARALLLSRCAVKANNISKFEAASNEMKKTRIDLISLMRKSSKNKSNNVEAAQDFDEIDLKRFLFSGLSEDANNNLFNKENHRDIANAYDGLEHKNPLSKIVSDKIRKYFDYKKQMLVESNAMGIETLNEDRLFGNVFERSKVISANTSLAKKAQRLVRREKFNDINTIKYFTDNVMNNLDIEDTFKYTNAKNADGSIDLTKARSIVENTHNNIVEDYSEIFTKSIVANDRDAVKAKSRMFFKWKNMNAYLNVSEALGSGDLFQDLMKDLVATSRKTGMARILGDSPESLFNDLKKVQKKIYREDKTKFTKAKERQAELLFNELKGTNKTAYDPTLASIGSAHRQLTAMSKLAFLPFKSLSDIVQGAGAVSRHGFSFWETAFENVKNIFNNPLMESETRKHLAEMMKYDLDSTMGYKGKFVDATDLGSAMSKMSNRFFYYNLTHGWDKGNKLGTLTMLTRSYGKESSKTFLQLNEQTRYEWQAHNLTANDWEVLRKNTVKLNGKDHFTLDAVSNLTKSQLRAMWEGSDKSIPLSQYKNAMMRRVYTLFDTSAEAAIVFPGAFERVVMGGNQRPGTYWGEAIKSFMQFKGFPIGFIRRNMIEAYNDLQGPQRKMMYAVNMMLSTLPLSYASTWLGYYAQGLTMPSFDEMSGAEKASFIASMILPGLGVFLSVLSKHTADQNMAISLVTSPSVKLFGNELEVVRKALMLDPEGSGKSLIKALKLMSPISSVPFVEPLMDKALGITPYLQPGQEVRDWAQ